MKTPATSDPAPPHAATVGPTDGPCGKHFRTAPPPGAHIVIYAATVAAATSDHGQWMVTPETARLLQH